MNILVFSWRDPKHPLAGGAEQVMHEHMKGWVEKGHKVDLFSSKVDGLPSTEIIEKVRIIRRGSQYLGVQLAAFFYYFQNRKKYDFIIDQFHGIPFFTPLYVDQPKLAVIQEVARNVWLKNYLVFPFNYLVGFLGLIVEPLIFKFYKNTHFMTGSQSAKKDIIKFGIPEKNISIVPHGVIGYKNLTLPKKEKIKTVTYLGKISKDKGIEDAIKTFAILNRMGVFQFWVIGKSETNVYFKKIKNLVAKFCLQKKVKFFGYVGEKEKFSLLAKSHILVNPSVHEGWGLVNIEANLVGTPVVAYFSPGLIDSVKNGVSGLIAPENNPENMAIMINTLLSNGKNYRQMSFGAINWANNFSWQRSQKNSLDLINRIYGQN